jgi:hypothetical protein
LREGMACEPNNDDEGYQSCNRSFVLKIYHFFLLFDSTVMSKVFPEKTFKTLCFKFFCS